MIRLSWLQFRVQAVTATAALAAFAILLAVTGPHLASLYAASTITGCHSGTCSFAANTFLSRLVPVSSSRAISGAPQKMPVIAGAARMSALPSRYTIG